MFKTLIAGGRFDKETGALKRIDPPLNFADVLYPVIKEHAIQWAVGPSSFTILALLESPDFSSKDELLKLLRKNKKALEKAATEETPAQKAKAEEPVKEGAKKSKSKAKGKDAKSKPLGNMGTKLVLEKMKA